MLLVCLSILYVHQEIFFMFNSALLMGHVVVLTQCFLPIIYVLSIIVVKVFLSTSFIYSGIWCDFIRSLYVTVFHFKAFFIRESKILILMASCSTKTSGIWYRPKKWSWWIFYNYNVSLYIYVWNNYPRTYFNNSCNINHGAILKKQISMWYAFIPT